LIKYSNKKSYC